MGTTINKVVLRIMRGAIEQAIEEQTLPFSVQDIVNEVPGTEWFQVRYVFGQMVRQGKIEPVGKAAPSGRGRPPIMYRNASERLTTPLALLEEGFVL